MKLTQQLELIIEAMVEAAEASTINPEMVHEINGLKTNGFNTRDLFGIRAHEFVDNRFEQLPLEQRVKWFDSLA